MSLRLVFYALVVALIVGPFALAQEQILKKHYALPMVQANTDLFYSSKLVFPLRNAEFTISDPFYIKAK